MQLVPLRRGFRRGVLRDPARADQPLRVVRAERRVLRVRRRCALRPAFARRAGGCISALLEVGAVHVDWP
jgi:hypothetical protein